MNILVVIALFGVPAFGAQLGPVKVKRIISGNNFDILDVPHHGSLRHLGSHYCGCALIGEKYVLTAAHCIKDIPASYTVQFGSSNRHLGGAIYAVNKIIIHPEYSPIGRKGLPNDIAILVLERVVEETESIQRIRMATPVDGDFANEECFITGWGQNITGGQSAYTSLLQGASINILSPQECKHYWSQTSAEYHVCVGGQGGPGACRGDSGGPLTCKVDGANVLVGLTSGGEKGCSTSRPSIYARVSTYQSWVLENTEGEL